MNPKEKIAKKKPIKRTLTIVYDHMDSKELEKKKKGLTESIEKCIRSKLKDFPIDTIIEFNIAVPVTDSDGDYGSNVFGKVNDISNSDEFSPFLRMHLASSLEKKAGRLLGKGEERRSPFDFLANL